MMWEGEYLEFASTAKAGYLTRAEAEANWARWKQDQAIPRDESGPRGFLRLFISTRTKVVQFNEVSKDKAFKKEEKVGKNASEQKISERFNMVLNSAGDAGIDDFDAGETMTKAAHAFASSGSAADAFDSGLSGVDTVDLMHEARTRTKPKKKLNGNGCDAEEMGEDEDEGEAGTSGGASKGENIVVSPDKAWFDETKVRKAQRTYLNSILGLEASLTETQLGMTRRTASVHTGLVFPATRRILLRTFRLSVRHGFGRFGCPRS